MRPDSRYKGVTQQELNKFQRLVTKKICSLVEKLYSGSKKSLYFGKYLLSGFFLFI